LIDRRTEPVHWSQAAVIKSRTLEILAALGVRDHFYQRGQVVNRVDVYAYETKMAWYTFDGLDTPFPHILSIPEEETIRILSDKLAELGRTIDHGVEFVGLQQNEHYVRVRLKSRQHGEYDMQASLVVGADGFHSAVRSAIAVDYEGRDHPGLWGVFDTELSNWDYDRDAVCAQLAAPVVIPFPLGKKLWRVYFWIETSGSDVLSLIVKRLRVISANVDLVNPEEPQFFHSHSRVARQFRRQRVFLAGDAAHVSNPIEGHGMNIGIQDAYNLGWKLASMAAGQATEKLMASYEAERRPAAEAIVQAGDEAYARMLPSGTDALQELFAFLSTPEGQSFAALAESELALGYEHSPIVEAIGATPGGPSPRTTKTGFRVGDVDGLIRAGRPCSLQDLICGTDPTVFVLLGTPGPADLMDGLSSGLGAASHDMPVHLNVFIVVRGETIAPTRSGEIVLDPTGQLHERLGAEQPSLFLIRPDGHLGLSCAPPSVEALRNHLQRMFLPA